MATNKKNWKWRMSIIKQVKAREIIDSRGNPTIEVDVYLNSEM